MSAVEDIILRYSRRGMDILRRHMPDDYCHAAARAMVSLPKGVILFATGFCVSGRAETDGPAGTIVMSGAVKKLGYEPVIVTDELCRGVFESEGFMAEYMPLDAGNDYVYALLDKYKPVGLFSLERCGINSAGIYANMGGRDIRSNTAPVDLLFTLKKGIPTFGVGDGGNEIGMGNLAGVIEANLSLTPCIVSTDYLIIATVSNWGGYGVCACIEELTAVHVLPEPDELAALMHRLTKFGLVDGMSGLAAATEDGFPEGVTHEIISTLNTVVRQNKKGSI